MIRYEETVTVTAKAPTSLVSTLVTKIEVLLPSVCGGGGFGYGGAGAHLGSVHGEILGLVEYDSRLGGAHGGLVGVGAGHFIGGLESMRTWSDGTLIRLQSVSRELRFQAPRVLLGSRSIHEVAILAALLNMRTATLA